MPGVPDTAVQSVTLFLDESGAQRNAVWSGGLVVPTNRVVIAEAALEDAVADVRRAHGLRGTPEIHATKFFGGAQPWKLDHTALEALALRWVTLLNEVGARYVFRGVNSSRLGGWQRWGTRQNTAFEIAFGHLVTALEAKLHKLDWRCDSIVHDDTSLKCRLTEHLERACSAGVLATNPTPCSRVAPSIDFRDSKDSRLLQAADVALWVQQRRWTDAGSGPRGHWESLPEKRKSRTAKHIADAMQPQVLVRHCWTPS
jgi:hypothetical protein